MRSNDDVMEDQTSVVPEVTSQIVVEQPKQSSFLIILLSILLIISVLIAGFFAYQTQKLVKELTMLRVEPTPIATIVPTTEPVATESSKIDSTTRILEKQKIETAAKSAFVKKMGQEPTTTYGLAEDSLVIIDNWAFGVITVAPVGEGAGPGANYFLARKINNIWDAKIEYTNEFKEWLKVSPSGLVNPDLKNVLQ